MGIRMLHDDSLRTACRKPQKPAMLSWRICLDP